MISLRCSPRSFWSENAILITLKTPCGIDVVLPTLPPRMVFSHILLSFSYPHRPLEIDTISRSILQDETDAAVRPTTRRNLSSQFCHRRCFASRSHLVAGR